MIKKIKEWLAKRRRTKIQDEMVLNLMLESYVDGIRTSQLMLHKVMMTMEKRSITTKEQMEGIVTGVLAIDKLYSDTSIDKEIGSIAVDFKRKLVGRSLGQFKVPGYTPKKKVKV